MNERKFIRMVSSAGIFPLALGGLISISGCTSPEDPPMPPGVYVPKKTAVATPAESVAEVSKNEPVITDPVIANVAPSKVIAQPAAPKKTAAKEQVYKVVKGDSLWSISRKYGLKIEELALYNNISAKSTLRIGQKLLIPPTGKVTAPSENAVKSSKAVRAKKSSRKSNSQTKKNKAVKKTDSVVNSEGVYIVKPGDNFSTIAKRNGVKVADIVAANPGVSSNKLQVGQKLNIKAGAGGTSIASAKNTASKAEKSTVKKAQKTTASAAPVAADAKKDTSGTDNLDQLLQEIKDPDQSASKTENNVPVATQKAVEAVSTPAAANDAADFSGKDKFEDLPNNTVVVTLGADTDLGKFCQKYQLKEADLKMLNPSIPADGKLKKGMVIKLP